MITGAFVRIKRDGDWQDLEIEQLTDQELEDLAGNRPDMGWKWAKFLAKWIRDNV